jgi:hypothetical protein
MFCEQHLLRQKGLRDRFLLNLSSEVECKVSLSRLSEELGSQGEADLSQPIIGLHARVQGQPELPLTHAILRSHVTECLSSM